MKLNDIIIRLQETVKQCDLAVNDTVILEQAIKIMISQNINESKKENIKSMKEGRDILKQVKETKSNEPEPIKQEIKASEKQIAYLLNLGYSGNIDLSKKEAMTLIKELKETRRFKQ
jgi:hypothetical protein